MPRQLEFWAEAGECERAASHATVSDTTRERRQTAQALLDNESLYVSLKRVSIVHEGLLMARPHLTSTHGAKDLFAKYWHDNPGHDQERFVVACLNTKNRVQSIVVITIGTLDAALIHPREVFKPAVIEGASSIILSHNHPSGDTTPSKEDYEVTDRLTEAGKVLGINVLDHIIYGDGTRELLSIRES